MNTVSLLIMIEKAQFKVSGNLTSAFGTLSGVWSITSNYKLKINYYVAIYI